MKRKPGWFTKAKLEWVRRRVRSFRISTGVGRFINDFEFERLASNHSTRSSDGREFEDLMRVSPALPIKSEAGMTYRSRNRLMGQETASDGDNLASRKAGLRKWLISFQNLLSLCGQFFLTGRLI